MIATYLGYVPTILVVLFLLGWTADAFFVKHAMSAFDPKWT